MKTKKETLRRSDPIAGVSFANTAGVGIAPHTVSPTRPGGSAVGRRRNSGLFGYKKAEIPAEAFLLYTFAGDLSRMTL